MVNSIVFRVKLEPSSVIICNKGGVWSIYKCLRKQWLRTLSSRVSFPVIVKPSSECLDLIKKISIQSHYSSEHCDWINTRSELVSLIGMRWLEKGPNQFFISELTSNMSLLKNVRYKFVLKGCDYIKIVLYLQYEMLIVSYKDCK